MAGSRLKDGLLGLLVALGLLALLEAALHLADPEALSSRLDPGARYLVAVEHAPGSWQTRFADAERPEQVVLPKTGRDRIVLLGGSVAAGFLPEWLEEPLDPGSDVPGVEVVNLGRNGYGSERVLTIGRQALELLAPDLLVVITGDIEFNDGVGWRDQPEAGWFWETRTARLLARLVQWIRDPSRTPEPLRNVYEEALDLTYDATLAHLEGLRRRLRALCEEAREQDVRVVLCTLVYNRLSAPFAANLPAEADEVLRARVERLHKQAVARTPRFLAPLLPLAERHRVHIRDWREGSGDAAGAALPGLRECLGPLAGRDRQAPDPSHWSSRIRRVHESLARFHARAVDSKALADLETSESLYEEALELVPEHARLHFELGLVKSLLGRDELDVEGHLRLAARYDCAPRKGSDLVNDMIREVAGEFDNAFLFDADEIFARRMPGRLTGWEWMLDHSHLHQGARVVLMQDLAAFLLDLPDA